MTTFERIVLKDLRANSAAKLPGRGTAPPEMTMAQLKATLKCVLDAIEKQLLAGSYLRFGPLTMRPRARVCSIVAEVSPLLQKRYKERLKLN